MASIAAIREPDLACSRWEAIREASCPLVVERRDSDRLLPAAKRLLADAPFERLGTWSSDGGVQDLGLLPTELAEDISALAARFASLMGVSTLRIRLETITTNACRKIHADATDIRLITTYAGPATQVLRPGAKPSEENLWSMQPGWIGLFKGRTFADRHAPCLHRSPPIEGSGATRLVLVIDTPAFPREGECR